MIQRLKETIDNRDKRNGEEKTRKPRKEAIFNKRVIALINLIQDRKFPFPGKPGELPKYTGILGRHEMGFLIASEKSNLGTTTLSISTNSTPPHLLMESALNQETKPQSRITYQATYWRVSKDGKSLKRTTPDDYEIIHAVPLEQLFGTLSLRKFISLKKQIKKFSSKK